MTPRLIHPVRELTADLWDAVQHVERANEEIRSYTEEIVHRLSLAAEYRDEETGTHIERMSHYAELLARRAGMDEDRARLIRLASRMHDVGKIAVPDRILRKPGPLTPAEFEQVKQHCDIGHRILEGSRAELLGVAATIAWTHHERWDGSGYPRGLAGEGIPVEGRIAAIADAFDAITSERVYKRAAPLGEAVDRLRAGRGTHFDPALLDLFLGSLDEVVEIMSEHLEPAAPRSRRKVARAHAN